MSPRPSILPGNVLDKIDMDLIYQMKFFSPFKLKKKKGKMLSTFPAQRLSNQVLPLSKNRVTGR